MTYSSPGPINVYLLELVARFELKIRGRAAEFVVSNWWLDLGFIVNFYQSLNSLTALLFDHK